MATATGGSLSAYKLKAFLPAFEMIVAKALVPYPSVDVHIQGLNVLNLPMSDETLCHYLAWFLAEYFPMFT